jgi:hypothetical protein
MAEGERSSIFAVENSQGIVGKMSGRRKWLVGVFLLIVLSFGGYFIYKWITTRSQSNLVTQSGSASQAPSEKTTILKNDITTNETPVPLFGDANYQSENFRVGDIAIGGEAEFLLTEDTPEPLQVSEIRGEAFTEKNKPEVKLVLSWKTNKLAKSEITYSKGIGQAKKTMNEEDFNMNHSLIIPGLDQASTYLYTIVSRDRFGNEITSDQHAVYTGSKTISLFDLIAGAIGDVFGWAIKKN